MLQFVHEETDNELQLFDWLQLIHYTITDNTDRKFSILNNK
jgi:hypothetical protein